MFENFEFFESFKTDFKWLFFVVIFSGVLIKQLLNRYCLQNTRDLAETILLQSEWKYANRTR